MIFYNYLAFFVTLIPTVHADVLTDYFGYIDQLSLFALVNGLELYHGFDESSIPYIAFENPSLNSSSFAIEEDVLDYLTSFNPQTFGFYMAMGQASELEMKYDKVVEIFGYNIHTFNRICDTKLEETVSGWMGKDDVRQYEKRDAHT